MDILTAQAVEQARFQLLMEIANQTFLTCSIILMDLLKTQAVGQAHAEAKVLAMAAGLAYQESTDK